MRLAQRRPWRGVLAVACLPIRLKRYDARCTHFRTSAMGWAGYRKRSLRIVAATALSMSTSTSTSPPKRASSISGRILCRVDSWFATITTGQARSVPSKSSPPHRARRSWSRLAIRRYSPRHKKKRAPCGARLVLLKLAALEVVNHADADAAHICARVDRPKAGAAGAGRAEATAREIRPGKVVVLHVVEADVHPGALRQEVLRRQRDAGDRRTIEVAEGIGVDIIGLIQLGEELHLPEHVLPIDEPEPHLDIVAAGNRCAHYAANVGEAGDVLVLQLPDDAGDLCPRCVRKAQAQLDAGVVAAVDVAGVLARRPVELRAKRAAGVAAGEAPDAALLLAGAGETRRLLVVRAVAERSVEAAHRRRVVRDDARLAGDRCGDHVAGNQAVGRGVDVVRAGLCDHAVRPPDGLPAETHVAPAAAET